MSRQDTPIVAARRKRLQEWLDQHFEGSQAAFVTATGINQGELSLLLKSKSFGERRAASLEALAKMPPGHLVSPLTEQQPAQAPAGPVAPRETPADYVRAIDLGTEGDMGDGRVNDDYPEAIRAVDYTQQYIRGLMGFVPPPGRLVLITGRGDSMIPTIQPGESLLVDTGVTAFERDGIYLVNLGNGQQIKRLIDHGADEGVRVHSDNPAYPTIRWPKGGVVGGKVYLRNRTDRLD